jgi:hypothetical protein
MSDETKRAMMSTEAAKTQAAKVQTSNAPLEPCNDLVSSRNDLFFLRELCRKSAQ